MVTATGTALVAGAAGIIGDAVMRELDANGWTVRGLSRRPLHDRPSIQADLTDAEAAAAALRGAKDTTHLFYAALSPDADPATEATRNAAMLGNLLDGLEAAVAPLQRVIIYQGFKIYGIHLVAKVPTPARESDPPQRIWRRQHHRLRNATLRRPTHCSQAELHLRAADERQGAPMDPRHRLRSSMARSGLASIRGAVHRLFQDDLPAGRRHNGHARAGISVERRSIAANHADARVLRKLCARAGGERGSA
jgi:hypothetical protein